MDGQVQCPNCGGYRVSTTTFWAGGRLRRKPSTFGPYWAWFQVLAGACMVIVGLVIALAASGDPMPLSLGIMFAAIGAFEIVMGVLGMNVKTSHWNQHCILCDYQWKERPGDPKPVVQVRPDLIQKGAQRLQEEDRQRRLDD